MRDEPFGRLRTATFERLDGACRSRRMRPSTSSGHIEGSGQVASHAPSRWAIVAASTRLVTPSLLRMLDTCSVAVFGLMKSVSAI